MQEKLLTFKSHFDSIRMVTNSLVEHLLEVLDNRLQLAPIISGLILC
jgi:hypothetical protein